MAVVVAAALAVPAAMAVLAALAPGLWAAAAVVAGLDAAAVAGLVWLVRQWRPERPVFTQAARGSVAGGVRRALPARVPLAIEAPRLTVVTPPVKVVTPPRERNPR